MSLDISRELKRGTLDMLVLSLLSQEDMYGYQLISTLRKSSSNVFDVKEGTLYPMLHRLEDSDLIESYWETADRGVPRKYYRITSQGKSTVCNMLRAWGQFVSVVSKITGGNGDDDSQGD